MAESHEHDSEDFCYICFEGATRGASGEVEPLVQVCRCPTRVHRRCVARWQLYSAGKREEKSCRFCQDALPDWKEVLTPRALPPAVPVLSIYYNNTCCRMKVRPGPDGLQAFLRQLEAIVGRDVANVNFVFRCRCPDTGAEIFLQGLQAFEAAMHCACVRAAQRSLQQHHHQQQQQLALLVQPQQQQQQVQQQDQQPQQRHHHLHHHHNNHNNHNNNNQLQQRQVLLGSGVSYMLGDTTAATAAASQGLHPRRASAPTERVMDPAAAAAAIAATAIRSGDPSTAGSGSSGRHPPAGAAILESVSFPQGGATASCVEAVSHVSTAGTATLPFSSPSLPPPPAAASTLSSPAPSTPLLSQREHQRRQHPHYRLNSLPVELTAAAGVQQVVTPHPHCRTAFQPPLLNSGDVVMPGTVLPGAVHAVSTRISPYSSGIETPTGSESRAVLSRAGTGASSLSSSTSTLAAQAEAAAVVARVAAFVLAPCAAAAGTAGANGGRPLPPSGPATADVAAAAVALPPVASPRGPAQPSSKRANGAGSCVGRGGGGGKASGGGGKVAAALAAMKSLKGSLLRRFGGKATGV